MKINIRILGDTSFFIICNTLAILCLFLVSVASGEVKGSIDLRGVYEDNITGSAADVGKGGDYYSVLTGSLGVFHGIGADTQLFLKGDADGYLYNNYTELNAVVVAINGGVYKELNDLVAVQFTLKAKKKEFNDSQRSSVAIGGSIEVKEQVSPIFWLKQEYEFEKNNANKALFSYRGNLIGVSAGYVVFPKATLIGGYSYMSVKYEEPANFRDEFHTISFGLTREILKKVHLYGNYSRQFINSTSSDSGHTNNIYAMGLLYSF